MILHTISEQCNSEYKVQSSKFLSFAIPISNEVEAKSKIKLFQKTYGDATHVCYAYALGNHAILKSHDAGEPSHTAGTPILNVIRSESMTQILVLVVRYFGGTKLGKPGLIQAYKTASLLCIQNSQKIPFVERVKIAIEITYEQLGQVMEIIKKHQCQILNKTIDDVCQISFEIPLAKESEIRSLLPITTARGE
ncbi:MAG: YigZ family protein [Cytophagales bacterium]|nr:YigZ family protein [Cytophagales bacterium]